MKIPLSKTLRVLILYTLASGFLIGISIKYLLECYTGIFAFQIIEIGAAPPLAHYANWFSPLLDFIPVLIIGLLLLMHGIKRYLRVTGLAESTR